MQKTTRSRLPAVAALILAVCVCGRTVTLRAVDWPYDRGKDGLGVWEETGLLEAFPASGLTVRWRTPVKIGYSGAAVADGRVFITDFEWTTRPRGTERVLALDEQTGRVLWRKE